MNKINQELKENIRKWSEGNKYLEELLIASYENGMETKYSCAGHRRSDSPYVTFKLEEKNKGKVYNIVNEVSSHKNIQIAFSNNGIEQTPSFTVYMKNDKNKNKIFETMTKAVCEEKNIQDEGFEKRLQELFKIKETFENKKMYYSMNYDLDKRNLMISHLKTYMRIRISSEFMKNKGFNEQEDLYGAIIYYKNRIPKGDKEAEELSYISKGFQNIELENRLADKPKTSIFNKIKGFFKKEEELNIESNESTTNNDRNDFIEKIKSLIENDTDSNNDNKEKSKEENQKSQADNETKKEDNSR